MQLAKNGVEVGSDQHEVVESSDLSGSSPTSLRELIYKARRGPPVSARSQPLNPPTHCRYGRSNSPLYGVLYLTNRSALIAAIPEPIAAILSRTGRARSGM